jgi:SAM-dependent methyltransferase
VERNHWWFSVRRKLLKSILLPAGLAEGRFIIDVGCGVGSNVRVLREMGLNVVGLDRSFDNLELAKQKGEFTLVNGDLLELPFRSASVSLLIAMDVLEHLDDDAKGIRELGRCLAEGGMLILTVPAFTFLWGVQDIVTNHKRRYTRGEILRKLREENFEIVRSSYFNFFLFFPILIGRRVIRLLGLRMESENEVNASWLNYILKAIFSNEPLLIRYVSLPFAVSIFCIARKRGRGSPFQFFAKE